MKNRNTFYRRQISPIWIIISSIAVVIIPFFIWVSFARVDQISHAKGQVIAAAKTQEIQAANEGVVEKVLIKEGENVKKGQSLVKLDRSQAQAAYEESKAKVAALQAALTRLNAEVYGKSLTFSSLSKEYPEFISNQTALYTRRQQGLNDEISALKDVLLLSQNELDLNLPLLKSGDIGATEIIRLKRQIADISGQISNKRNKYFQESQADMTKAEEELSTKEQEFADRTVTLNRMSIHAPVDAIVKNILITTQGARVRPGDVIMELVPFGDELIVEAKLSPESISFVTPGQLAAVKLDAYDYSIYGIFKGTVKYISPDTLIEKTPQGDKTYFRVIVSLKQHQLIAKSGKHINITPGMTTTVDIVTGNRTILEFLLKPVIKTVSESFHER